jgi:hyperosmotically inducible protein
MRIRRGLIVLSIALAGVMTILMAGCNQPREEADKTLPNTTAGAKIDDSVITTTVKLALLADPDINSLGFKVETHKGKVQLSGYVDSQTQIDRLIAVTHGVSGVKGIKITVNSNGTVRMAGNKINNKTVTIRVKVARLADASATEYGAVAVTNKDKMLLSDLVDDRNLISDSVEVARGIDGVRSVSNEMSIKY